MALHPEHDPSRFGPHRLAGAGHALSLVQLTADLIGVPSVSGNEGALAERVAMHLAGLPGQLTRVAHNVVYAAPRRGRPLAVLAGHLDTVPPQGNETPRVEGDRLYGLGASDMKAGLAVMLELARSARDSRFDLAYVFYECEEVALERNGLRKLWPELPWLAQADVAIVLEPTDCTVELGCVGSLNVEITAIGTAAHSARQWLGDNAVYKALPLLERLRAMEPRPVTLAGVTYQETLQVTVARAGIGRNVVPDRFTVNVNRRYAPNRTPEDAIAEMRALVPESFAFEVVDVSPPAPPHAEATLVAEFLSRTGCERRAKQGWTDVAQFTERGVPAFNFGPGVPEQAHTAGESLPVANLDRAYRVLEEFLT